MQKPLSTVPRYLLAHRFERGDVFSEACIDHVRARNTGSAVTRAARKR